MSVEFDELPAIVKERITEIVNKLSIPQETVMQTFVKVCNIDFIARAPQDVLKYTWASLKLHTDYFSRPPIKERNFIPIGVDGIQKFKGQEAQQTVFAYDLDTNKKISIKVDKKSFKTVKEMTIGEYYPETSLAVTDRGNFLLDDRTELPEPQPYFGIDDDYPTDMDNLLSETLEIRQIQMSDFGNSKLISRVVPTFDKKGVYTDNLDWVCIRNCFVLQSSKIDVKEMNGVSRGKMSVSDGSVAEEFTTNKGIVVGNRMNVFVAPRHLYPENSVLHLWGSVKHSTWKQQDPNDASKEVDRQNFQMNAYYAFPVNEGPEQAN